MVWNGANEPIGRIGLVGIGVMGKCMLEKLREKGYSVSCYDAVPASKNLVTSLGGDFEDSLKSLGEKCSVIILSLPGPVQIEQVVLKDSGLYPVLTDRHVIIDTSTVDPDSTRCVAEKVMEKGTAYVDAPIFGRPSAVGKWMMPSGGMKDVVTHVTPVLESFAAAVVHVGGPGSGNTLKLLNQLMFTAINGITSEVLAIAEKAGIDKKVFFDVVAGSGAATVSGLFKEVGRNIVEENYHQPTFTVDLMIKDVKLALQMAENAGAPSVLAQTVQNFNEIASALGLGKEDTSALYKVFHKLYEGEKSNETEL